jgi:MFS family permease
MEATALVAPRTRQPLGDRSFALFLAACATSFFGDQFYLVALPWLVLQQTGSVITVSAIMMATAIPRAVLMLLGGAVTDRVSPRKIMMATASSRCFLVAAVGAFLSFHILHVWELYILGFSFGVADAFSSPAAEKLLPSLAPSERLVAANSIFMGTAQLAAITAPVPAGIVIKKLGVAWAFFADAISFLFIIVVLWRLPDPPSHAETSVTKKAVWHTIADGIGDVLKDGPLRSLVVLGTIVNFCTSGLITVGLPYLIRTKFNSPTSYAIVVSATAAGGLLGSLLAGVLQVRRLGIIIVSVSATIGLLVGSVGLVGSLWMVSLALFAMGAAEGVVNVHCISWVQKRVDIAARGRVMSVLMLSVVGLLPISLPVTGVLVAWNLRFAFLLAAGVTLLASVTAASQKAVRQIE